MNRDRAVISVFRLLFFLRSDRVGLSWALNSLQIVGRRRFVLMFL